MRYRLFFIPLMLVVLFIGITSCDEESDKDDILIEDTLYVKFENSEASEYTITGIRLLVMGVAGNYDEPDGEFSTNILESGTTIAPGGHVFLTLDIPGSYYAYYRVTIDDGSGNQVYLFSQPNYGKSYDGVITHWGSDERTVSVTIVWDDYSDLINASGWSDFAGID